MEGGALRRRQGSGSPELAPPTSEYLLSAKGTAFIPARRGEDWIPHQTISTDSAIHSGTWWN
jgi:hypothetical protein